MIRAAIAAAGVAAVAVVAAPPAVASPLTYLRLLDQMGITVWDTQSVVAAGWEVCDALEVYDPVDVGLTLDREYADVSMEDAATIVVVAISELCPQFEYKLEAVPSAAAPVSEGPLKRRLV